LLYSFVYDYSTFLPNFVLSGSLRKNHAKPSDSKVLHIGSFYLEHVHRYVLLSFHQ
jgi:hypothetical protein